MYRTNLQTEKKNKKKLQLELEANIQKYCQWG